MHKHGPVLFDQDVDADRYLAFAGDPEHRAGERDEVKFAEGFATGDRMDVGFSCIGVMRGESVNSLLLIVTPAGGRIP